MPTGIGGEVLWLCPSIENSARNITGAGFSGSYVGDVSTAIDSSNGGKRAYDFVGTSRSPGESSGNPGDYIKVSNKYGNSTNYSKSLNKDDSSSLSGVEEFSICFWVNPSDWHGAGGSSNNAYLINCGVYELRLSPTGVLTFSLETTYGTYQATISNIPKDSWSFVCATFSSVGNKRKRLKNWTGPDYNGIIELYLNGVYVSAQRWVEGFETLKSDASDLTIGGREQGWVDDFSGKMDDIRIFNRELTSSEIKRLYTKRGVQNPPHAQSGLGDEQLWVSPTLTLDDVSDISGNGNTALLDGTVPVVEDTTGFESFQTDNTTLGTDYVYFNAPSASDLPSASLAFWASSNFTTSYGPVGGFCTSGFNDLRFFFGRKALENVVRLYAKQASGGVTNTDISMPAGKSLTDGVMRHWVITCSGGIVFLYLDGVLIGQTATAFTSDLDIGGINLSLGSQDGRTTSGSAAKYDDIRFYDHAITQSEISHLASQRGVLGAPPEGLGDESLWLCPSLNDSATDLSGNGNNGIYNGGMSTSDDTDPIYGGTKAYNFDGVDDYIETTNIITTPADPNPSPNYGGRPGLVTYSFWLKSSSSQQSVILSTYNSSGAGWAEARLNDTANQVSFQLYDGSQYEDVVADAETYNDGTWRHFIVESDYNGRIYVNGIRRYETFQGGWRGSADLTSTEVLRIGNRQSAGGLPLEGQIDDFRCFQRKLTREEIEHLGSQRGVLGKPRKGIGDEKLWLCPSLTENLSDISGNNHNVEYKGGMGTTFTQDGTNLYSGVFEFDGVDDKIVVKNSEAIQDLPAESYSCSIWIKPDTSGGSGNGEFFNKGYETGAGWELMFRDGTFGTGTVVNTVQFSEKFQYDPDNRTSENHGWSIDNALSLGVWQHVVYTFERGGTSGNVSKIYVNGAQVATQTHTVGVYGEYLTDAANPLYIGARADNARNFDGLMDDIRLYDRVLTQAEIYHLSSRRGIGGAPPQGIGDEKLWLCPQLEYQNIDERQVRFYSSTGNLGDYGIFAGSERDRAVDLSGEGNHGTIKGRIQYSQEGTNKSYKIFHHPTNEAYIELPTTGFNSSRSAFTVCFWLLPSASYDTYEQVIFNAGDSSGTRYVNVTLPIHSGLPSGYDIYTPTKNIQVGGSSDWLTVAAIEKNRWQHICYTYDGTNVKLYKDGLLIGSRTDSPVSVNEDLVYIGKHVGGGSGVTSIDIDDIRTFARVINEDEIGHLASNRAVLGKPKTKLTTLTSSVGGEMLWLAPSVSRRPDLDLAQGRTVTNNGSNHNARMARSGGGGLLTHEYALTGSMNSGNAWQSVNFGTGGIPNYPLTLSLWVKPDSNGSGGVSITGGGSGRTIKLAVNSNGQAYLLRENYASSGQNYITDTVDIRDAGRHWHHLCATIEDPRTAFLYVDGSLVGRSDNSYIPPNANFSTLQTSTYGRPKDDIRLFNKILTAQEIKTLASKRIPEGLPSYSGLGDEKVWLCPSLGGGFGDLSDFGPLTQGRVDWNTTTIIKDEAEKGGSLAFNFDGVDDYISFDAAGSEDLSSLSGFSYSAWVKDTKTSSGGNLSTKFSFGVSGSASYPQDIIFYRDTASPSMDQWQVNNGVDGSATSSSSVDEWVHHAIVFDGTGTGNSGRLRYFKNGVEVSLNYGYTIPSTTGTGGSSSAHIRIGSYTGSPAANYFEGQQDDIRIYHRAITQKEIKHLASKRGALGTPPQGVGDELFWFCPSLDETGKDLSNNSSHPVHRTTSISESGISIPEMPLNNLITTVDTEKGGKLATNPTYYNNRTIYNRKAIGFSEVYDFNGSFSVSMWVKMFKYLHDNYNEEGRIFWNVTSDSGGSRVPKGVGLHISTPTGSSGRKGELVLAWNQDYWGDKVCFLDDNEFHHIVLTYDQTTAKVYDNGVEVYSAAKSSPVSAHSTSAKGFLDSGATYIDDVRIFERVVNQSEIKHLGSKRGALGPAFKGLGDEQLWWCPTLSSSVGLDSSGYEKAIGHIGAAPTLVADTGAGGEYAGQIPNNGAVRVNDPVQFMTTGDCSAAGWIKASSSVNLTMIGQQAGGVASTKSGALISQSSASGQSRAKFFDGVNNDELLLQGGNAVPNNTWYHAAITKEGSTCKLFVNGVLLASGTQIGIPSNPDYKDLLIGAAWNVSTPVYGGGGYIDDVRLYNRALTEAEITHLASKRGVLGAAKLPAGLGGETCWICPTLTQSSTQDSTSSGLTITTTGNVTVTADTGAGGTHANFCQGDGTSQAGHEVIIDNFGNTYAEATSVSWWSRRTAGAIVIEMGGGTNEWPSAASSRFYYQHWNGADRCYMYNTSGGTNGWINETGSNATWKHHVMVREGVGGKNRLYINGVLDTEEHDDGGAETTGKDMYFGIGGGGSNNGELYIDDMRTYGRILTQEEITHLASQRGVLGTPKKYSGLEDEVVWICPTLSGHMRDISSNKFNVTASQGTSSTNETPRIANVSGSKGSKALESITEGVNYKYLSIDGEQLKYVAPFDNKSSKLSFSFWGILDSWSNSPLAGGSAFGKSNDSGDEGFSFSVEEGSAGDSGRKLKAYVKHPDSTQDYSRSNSVEISQGQWNHYAVCFDGALSGADRLKLYLNGEKLSLHSDSSNSSTAEISSTAVKDLLIMASSRYDQWDGKMDDIRVFDRVLTGSEILHLSRSRAITGKPKFKGVNMRAGTGVTDPDGFSSVLGTPATEPSAIYTDARYNSDRGYGFYVYDVSKTRGVVHNGTSNPHLAGSFYSQQGEDGLVFRLDLPDGAGLYRVFSAHHDGALAWNSAFSFYDGNTVIHRMASSGTTAQYSDIQGNVKAVGDFNLSSERYIEHNFKSTFLIVAQGPNSIGNDYISSLWVEKISSQIGDIKSIFNSDQIITKAFNNKAIG